MIKKLFSLSTVLLAFNISAQCPTASTPTKNCSTGERIEAFSLNSIAATGNTGCGTSGYSSSSQTWSLTIGQTYNFTATTGLTAGIPDAFAIFIDMNSDNQFTANEMLASNAAAVTHTGNITVPFAIGNTAGGPKKMRLICNANIIANIMGCSGGTSPFGEVEDYNILLFCPTSIPANIVAPLSLCSGQTATLSTTTALQTYTWFPGGTTSNTLQISSTATVAGTDSYSLLTSVLGCGIYTIVSTVSVAPTPTVSIFAPTTLICPGSTGLTLTGVGATSFTWNSGSTTLTTSSIIYNPAIGGSQIYNLVGLDGFCLSSNSSTISVSKTSIVALTPTISATNSILCGFQNKPLTASLTNTGVVSGNSYSWSPTSETTAVIQATSPANVSGTKTYTVYSGYTGCPNTFTNSAVITITVEPSPTILITGSSIICPTDPTTSTLTVIASGSFTWSANAGSVTTNTVIVTPTITTVYSVSSILGNCSNSGSIQVKKYLPLAPTLAATSTLVCGPTSTTITLTGGGNSYTWSPISSPNNILLVVFSGSVSSTNTFTVVTSNTDCPLDVATKTITLISNPIPTITVVGNTLLCRPNISSTLLTASGASTYSWSNGFNSASINPSPLSTTIYTVTSLGLNCNASKTVTVTVASTPSVVIVSSTKTLCLNNTATITATGGTNYLWNNGMSTPTITLTATTLTGTATSYTVIVSNVAGCFASESYNQILSACNNNIDELKLIESSLFPNPFTDIIQVSIYDNFDKIKTIEIYDAIGKLIIKQNIIGENIKINTSDLLSGIYIYKIYTSENATKIGKLIKN